MDEKVFKQFDSWFGQLNQKMDGLDLKFENRFTTLMLACTNIRKDLVIFKSDIKDIEDIQDRYEARIVALELALKEIERQLNH